MINRGYHIETEILQKNIVTSGEHFSNLLTRSDQRVLGSLTSKYRRHEWYGVECNKASANYPTSMLKQSVIASNHCTTSTCRSVTRYTQKYWRMSRSTCTLCLCLHSTTDGSFCFTVAKMLHDSQFYRLPALSRSDRSGLWSIWACVLSPVGQIDTDAPQRWPCSSHQSLDDDDALAGCPACNCVVSGKHASQLTTLTARQRWPGTGPARPGPPRCD